MVGDDVSETNPAVHACEGCGGDLKLAAGSIAKLSGPGFVDLFSCDACGKTSTREQQLPAPDDGPKA